MVDVTVMGGGVFGLAAALACARRGARVRLVEVRRIGAGASGGVVGALAPHAPEGWTPAKALQFQALLEAEAYWSGVAAEGGLDPGYRRSGRLQPLADADAVARAQMRAAAAAEVWEGRATWQVRPIAPEEGMGLLAPTGLVVADDLSARLSPRGACAALAAALRAAGGEIRTGEAEPGTSCGTVIWATGWEGLQALAVATGKPAGGGVKGQAAVLRLDRRDAPQVYAGGLHIVPHADGTVAIGSTTEAEFDAAGTTDARLDDLVGRARAICPALGKAEVVERWAGVRPRAPRRTAVIGPWPGRPGHFIANGGFKIGFALAPVAASLVADLVLDGVDRVPADMRTDMLPG